MEIKTYSKEYYENEKKFCVEGWYDQLSHLTAKTYFIPLNTDEINTIRSYYKCIMLHKEKNSKEQAQIMLSLEEKINKILKDNKIKNFFVRLTMRSPKDGISYNNTKLNEGLEKLDKITNYTDKLKFIFRIQEQDLKCSSASDALNLTVTSERIFTDLYRYLEMQTNIGEILYEQNLIIREWVCGLSSEKEFRCFVYKNKLTAISQYNHYITIPELQNKDYLNKVKTIIFNHWDAHVKKLLTDFENYIVDFGLIDNDQVFLIELNPFDTKTGPCLFHWTVDRNILLNEEKNINVDKIEIRSKDEEIANLKEFVDDFYIEELKSNIHEKKYDYYYKKYDLNKVETCIIY